MPRRWGTPTLVSMCLYMQMYVLKAVQSDWLDLSGFLGWVIVTIYNTGVVAWRGVSDSVVIQ